MSVTRDIFNERRDEISAYFQFMTEIIDYKAALIFPLPLGSPDETIRIEKTVSLELSHTLKANGFLLLYNLVEATMCNAIDEIHDTIGNLTTLGADDLNETLSKTAIRSFRNGAMQITNHCANPISQSILLYWLGHHQKSVKDNQNPLFSGNVDARKIREVAEKYGFSHNTNSANTQDGRRLLLVKTKRNDLAHGHSAFKECGRDIPLSDLMEIKAEVLYYLDEILTNIESYMNNKKFLRTTPTAVATVASIVASI